MSFKVDPKHSTTFDDRTSPKFAASFMRHMGEKGNMPVGYELFVEHDRHRKSSFGHEYPDFIMRGGVWTDYDGWPFKRGETERSYARASGKKIGGRWENGIYASKEAFGRDSVAEGNIVVVSGTFLGGVRSGFGILCPKVSPSKTSFFKGIYACPSIDNDPHATGDTLCVTYPHLAPFKMDKYVVGQIEEHPDGLRRIIPFDGGGVAHLFGGFDRGFLMPATATEQQAWDQMKDYMAEATNDPITAVATYDEMIQYGKDMVELFRTPRKNVQDLSRFLSMFVDPQAPNKPFVTLEADE